MLHHIALHCDATSGASMSPLGLYHIWVLSVLETLPYLYDTMSSGIIEIPDVALQCIAAPELHCIALQPQISPCSPSCIHQYLNLINIWNSFISNWQYLQKSLTVSTSSTFVQMRINIFKKSLTLSNHTTLTIFSNMSKGLWPFFQRRTNFPHQRQLKPKLIVVKLSNQKSPTLSIFLHDKHRSFIMII